MYRDGERVPLPPKENRILQKTKKATYVCYFTRRWWDKEKRRTVDDRVSVGRLAEDGESMIPNARWREIQGQGQGRETARYRSVGAFLALRAAAEQAGLLAAMREHLPGYCDSLLALITYVVDDGCATPQLFDSWCYLNYCGLDRPLSDDAIAETCQVAADERYRDDLMAAFRAAYLDAVSHKGGRTAVVLDATDAASHGRRGVPQVDTALVVDEATGIPLHFEDFHGSLLDMSESPVTAERVLSLGFERVLFAAGPGYATAECASALTEAGLEFTMTAPESSPVLEDMMSAHGQEVRREAHYIYPRDCYGLVAEGVSCMRGTYDAHLFFDASRANGEIDSIHCKAQHLLAQARRRQRYTDEFRDAYAPHVTITQVPKDPETGRTYRAEINHEAMQEEVDAAGYFLVVASPGHTSDEVLGTQRLRNRVEREFRRYDSFFGMLASGARDTRVYGCKTFMAFLALVACEALRWLTRDVRGRHDTVQAMLAELRKLQCCRGSDGRGSLATGMTKTQKEIFACLGMSEADVREAVAELSP